VQVVEADATCYRPAEPVDCVYFSYSLSMIPQWRAALANAHSMLRPGGLLGCVDFHVARAAPPAGWARHGPLARRLWPLWFAHDGVHLDPERLPTLVQSCETVHRSEHLAPLPYLPGLRVPYFVFVGRRAG
jgi:S-adenosylmethionine-diacylgycerolhomoserine-N-methlytransferase